MSASLTRRRVALVLATLGAGCGLDGELFLREGTVLLVHFDGVAEDVCGEPEPLRASDLTFTPSGRFAGAVALDHAGARLELASSPRLELDARDFTLELWALATGFADGDPLLSSGAGAATPWRLTLAAPFGESDYSLELVVTPRDGGARVVVRSMFGALALNTWHHVVVQRASDGLELFVDGVLAGRSELAPGLELAAGPLLIGGADDAEPRRLSGRIDEVRLTSGVARHPAAGFSAPIAPYGSCDE